MTEVKRLKVIFIRKDTMTKIENVHRIIVRPTSDGELEAIYYDVNDDYEVEIKVVE
jgi:hypothetical protein